MRQVKRLLVTMLVVAMVLSTAGIASAAISDVVGTRFEEGVGYLEDLGVVVGYPDGTFLPEATITRAEAVKIIVVMKYGNSDLANLLKGASPFSDVPGAHWASGYITLAKNAGIVNGYPDGTFMPNGLVTYAEFAKMLVEAAGLEPVAGLAWPANYVGAAQAAGMLGDVPDFSSNEPAIRGDCAIMAAFTVQEVEDPATGKTLGQSVFGETAVATLTITPASENVAIGEAVAFAVTAVDADGAALVVVPSYSTSDATKSAVSSTGLFVASGSGSYTVTATVDGKTATATVTVYGVAKGLRAVPATASVVANATSTVELTVEVVDANGFVVENDDDTDVTVEYGTDGNNGAVDLPSTVTKTVSGGKTTFKFTASDMGDRTDTLKFKATDLTSGYADVSSVDPVATSIEVTAAPANITSNSQTTTTVSGEVQDQDGVLLDIGVYSLKFEIAGPGTFTAAGSIAAKSNPTMLGVATQDVYSIQGDPGTIVVTVSCEGMTSGTVSIGSYVAGIGDALKVEVLDNTVKSGSTTDMAEFQVTLVDSQGRPTTNGTDITLEVDFSNGDDLSDEGLVCNGVLTILAGTTASDVLTIEDDTGATAGTFTVRVRDAARDFTQATFDLAVAAGSANKLSVSPSSTSAEIRLPISNPAATITVQLKDAAGNSVAKADVEVVCTWVDLAAVGFAYINGTKMATTATEVDVKTDAAGKATFALTAQKYMADDHQFAFTATDLTGASSAVFTIVDRVATSISIGFRDDALPAATQVNRVAADAAEDAYLHVIVKDENGNGINGEKVEITFSNAAVNVLPMDYITYANVVVGTSPVITDDDDGNVEKITAITDANGTTDGCVVVNFQGALAGTYTITAKDVQVQPALSGSRSFRTIAGTTYVELGVQTAAGEEAELLDIDGNTPTAMRVFMTDNGGNPIVAATPMDVVISADVGTYEIRTTSSGAAVAFVTIGASTMYKTFYIVFDDDVEDTTLFAVEVP
jgi:hypothetical protein